MASDQMVEKARAVIAQYRRDALITYRCGDDGPGQFIVGNLFLDRCLPNIMTDFHEQQSTAQSQEIERAEALQKQVDTLTAERDELARNLQEHKQAIKFRDKAGWDLKQTCDSLRA